MRSRRYALIGGSIMLIMGVLALIPTLSTLPSDLRPLNFQSGYGIFLGIFPMNILNKLTLIALGLAGVIAARSTTKALPASILWSKIVFLVMGIAAILGLVPATQTLGGYWPLYGMEVLLHGVFALLGGYFGFALSSRAMQENRNRFGTEIGKEVHIASTPRMQSSRR
jgi:hypothetical protein